MSATSKLNGYANTVGNFINKSVNISTLADTHDTISPNFFVFLNKGGIRNTRNTKKATTNIRYRVMFIYVKYPRFNFLLIGLLVFKIAVITIDAITVATPTITTVFVAIRFKLCLK